MSVDMPARDCHVDLRCFGDSHMFRIALHTFSEILRPLANDVIGDDDAEKGYTGQCGEYDEIDATVSKNNYGQ